MTASKREEKLFKKLKMETYEEANANARELTHRMQMAEIEGGLPRKTPYCIPCYEGYEDDDSLLCHQEHCYRCRLEFRRSLVLEALRLGLDDGVFTRASIIPTNSLYPEGRLEDVNLPALVGRFSKQLERSAFADAFVIGGIDFSFNTFKNEPLGWQAQLYLLINREHTPQLDRDIRSAFPAASDAYRPYTIGPVEDGDLLRCLTYSYKNEFWTRSGYEEPLRKKKDGSPRLNDDYLPLKVARRVELGFWLSKYPVGARLILRNARRANPPNKPLRLTPSKPIFKGGD